MKTKLKDRKGVLGKFLHICGNCHHDQRVGIWKGRETWICSVCLQKNDLMPYDYYLYELKCKNIGG